MITVKKFKSLITDSVLERYYFPTENTLILSIEKEDEDKEFENGETLVYSKFTIIFSNVSSFSFDINKNCSSSDTSSLLCTYFDIDKNKVTIKFVNKLYGEENDTLSIMTFKASNFEIHKIS